MSRPASVPLSRRERRAQQRVERPPRARPRQPSPRPRWQSPMVLVSAGALIAGAALVVLALPKGPAAGDELFIPPMRYDPELVAGDVVGSPDAPVVIELYSDFQCPACQMFVTGRLPRLVSEYVVSGTVRIEAQDIDILGRGTPNESLELAAGARCAAEQDRYWQYHDIVFWNQGRENRGDHDAAFIGRVADAADVDRAAFDLCLARPDVRSAIEAQTAGALQAGVNSTPTLMINGQAMVGVPEYEQLASVIDQAAAAARASSPS